jgi:Na+/H+-translocating membrane pyrophosphatase
MMRVNICLTSGAVVKKGSDIHKAAVVGDTVGDPLKDTSGPSLNILIKLMAILSLVFATLFTRIHS